MDSSSGYPAQFRNSNSRRRPVNSPSQIESHQAVTRRVAASNRLYREPARPIAGGAARLPRLSLSPFPLFVRHPPQLPRLFVSVTWRRPICLHESIESLPRCFDLSSSYQPIPRPLIISPYTFDQRSFCVFDHLAALLPCFQVAKFKVKSYSIELGSMYMECFNISGIKIKVYRIFSFISDILALLSQNFNFVDSIER